MAIYSSIGAHAPDKSHTHPFPSDLSPFLSGGVVQHHLLSPSVQVRILAIVDETNNATVGDIVAALADHPDPVGAILVMAHLNILALEVHGVLDANTIVRRAEPA